MLKHISGLIITESDTGALDILDLNMSRCPDDRLNEVHDDTVCPEIKSVLLRIPSVELIPFIKLRKQ